MQRRTDGAHTPLDLASLDDWIAHGARRPNLRMVQAGRTFDEVTYTRTVRMGGRSVPGVVDPARVASLVARGATLVAQNLEVVLPRVRRFVAEVQAEISHPVQANAYLTPADAAGLGRHADTHDVLVLQVDGGKTWSVDGLGEVELSPGDVLYVPRGTMHAAWTGDVASLHLTFGVLCVTAGDVVRAALAALPQGGDRLPLGFATLDRVGLGAALAPCVDALAAEVGGVDGAAIAADHPGTAAPSGSGWLAPVVHPTALGPSDGLRRVESCRWSLDGDRAVLTAPGRVVSFPAAASAALAVVCERRELDASSLDGLDARSQLVVARRLVREGILVRVPSP